MTKFKAGEIVEILPSLYATKSKVGGCIALIIEAYEFRGTPRYRLESLSEVVIHPDDILVEDEIRGLLE